MKRKFIYIVIAVAVCGASAIAWFKMHNNIDVVVHEVPYVENRVAETAAPKAGEESAQTAGPKKQKRNIASMSRIDSYDFNPCARYIESDDESENDLVAYDKCIQRGTNDEASAEGVKFPYLSELSGVFTADIEAKFDVFLVINTEDRVPTVPSNIGNIEVPRQHVRVLVKKRPGTDSVDDNVFTRDDRGQITGVNNANLNEEVPELAGLNQVPSSIDGRYDRLGFSYLVPSTTGAANFKKTSNGVYLVNEVRSNSIRQNRQTEAPMSFQTYIDTRYLGGQESGIAIHGTPSRNHRLLGVERGSHGCARVHPDHARTIRDYLTTLTPRLVPRVNWQEWKSYQLQPSPLAPQSVSRIPVLFIIFNGYEPMDQAWNKTFDVNIWKSYASR